MGRHKIDQQRVASLYQNGVTDIKEIEAVTGYSYSAIRSALIDTGLIVSGPSRDGRSALGLDPNTLAKEYLQDGMTYQQLANKYGCTVTIIRKWLMRSELISKEDIRKPGCSVQRSDIDSGLIAQDYLSGGMNVTQIANKNGCTRETVYARLKKSGISTNRKTKSSIVKQW